LYYTTSGIITRIGGRPVHRLGEDWMECRMLCALVRNVTVPTPTIHCVQLLGM